MRLLLNRLVVKLTVVLAALTGLTCCDGLDGFQPAGAAPSPAAPAPPAPGAIDDPAPPPLIRQQAEMYPEARTGRFVSLADFEDAPAGPAGHLQVAAFSLQPGASLRWQPPIAQFDGHTLLQVAVYAHALRDDLRLTLTGRGRAWRSERMLLHPGWNTVKVDLQQIAAAGELDLSQVDRVSWTFADAAEGVEVYLDDILLIDNRRTYRPHPPGLTLVRQGRSYRLSLPHRPAELTLARGPEGLWRIEPLGGQLQLSAPGQPLPAAGEAIDVLGRRRIGSAEVLEHNGIRVRLGSTWYFPLRAGQWASLQSVPRVRWEHTFYGDGRWVVHGRLVATGRTELGAARVRFPIEVQPASAAAPARAVDVPWRGLRGRGDGLVPAAAAAAEGQMRRYRQAATIRRDLAGDRVFAPGDADRDGYDESQGCYFLAAVKGHCRFTLLADANAPLQQAVVRVAGPWRSAPSAQAAGRPLRTVELLEDGSALLLLEGTHRKPVAVEVTGRPR